MGVYLMVLIEEFITDTASQMTEYLQEKHYAFKKVEVLGITEFQGRLTVFTKLGGKK